MTDHFPDAGKMVPEALRLADALEWHISEFETSIRAAAELSRLHAENEALRAMSFDTKRDMKTEALLWLCREMLQELPIVHPQQGPRRNQLIHALNQRL